MTEYYDRIIIGAGFYGLYAAVFCARRGEAVLVLEYDNEPFKRATFINQARVHNGYHYPRSFSTAIKSAQYFRRFYNDFGFSIQTKFDQIYATSSSFSWTDARQFQKFCEAAHIKCEEVSAKKYFKDGYCDGAFLTEEYTYDAQILKKYFEEKISELPNVKIQYGARIRSIQNNGKEYELELQDDTQLKSSFVLNYCCPIKIGID